MAKQFVKEKTNEAYANKIRPKTPQVHQDIYNILINYLTNLSLDPIQKNLPLKK
jgi:hypothetical protein